MLTRNGMEIVCLMTPFSCPNVDLGCLHFNKPTSKMIRRTNAGFGLCSLFWCLKFLFCINLARFPVWDLQKFPVGSTNQRPLQFWSIYVEFTSNFFNWWPTMGFKIWQSNSKWSVLVIHLITLETPSCHIEKSALMPVENEQKQSYHKILWL